MDSASNDREEYLARLCKRMFALNEELSKAEAGTTEYAGTLKQLHQLKEHYKDLTGVYPRLPDSK